MKKFKTAAICAVLSTAVIFGFGACGAGKAGQTTGEIIRAPYEFFSGLGRGIQGKGRMPLREFQQNWSAPEPDPIFWQSDEQFFSEVQSN